MARVRMLGWGVPNIEPNRLRRRLGTCLASTEYKQTCACTHVHLNPAQGLESKRGRKVHQGQSVVVHTPCYALIYAVSQKLSPPRTKMCMPDLLASGALAKGKWQFKKMRKREQQCKTTTV
eukprot:scaffold40234_cov16-Tisochrysis_lutea.AAC.1